ncbi:hypothetical protein IFM89_017352 [Coptis chinensis]|uniref:TFIIB-type domain-containing protein n=1 Tax=Coptis chinensis TaxID=261450 RepID=A0A835H6W2_9MAGN|nr:hypothetical protein IFM89_017352 [Coptis chinensis]
MEDYCSDCKKTTVVVLDHSSGDTICCECGLVLEARYIDETSEWRTFENDTNNSDPNRVGGPVNPLLAENGGGLVTLISKPSGVKSLGWNHVGSNKDPDSSLIQAFKSIAAMCDRLDLVATIKDLANEIYKKVADLKSTRGRNRDAFLAACLFVACKQEHKARTLKEIHSIANGATIKEIGRNTFFIEKQLKEIGESMETGATDAGDFMRRFCSRLGMNHQAMKAAQEAVQNSKELDIRRNPTSVAAAVIYMITQLSDDRQFLKDVAIATAVAENTIKKSCKDLYPYASRLIPNWYAKDEDLKNLDTLCQ